MWRVAVAVALKDLRIERQSRVLLWQVLPFAVIALVLCALAVGPSPSVLRRDSPGLFYLVLLLVTLLVIGRAHTLEAPTGTRSSVRMLGLDPAGVFLGKTAALFVELLIVATLLLTGVTLLLHAPLMGTVAAVPGIVLSLGALAAGGTLFGALSGDSPAHATLLPVIALPPFAGILIVGERAFAHEINGGGVAQWLIFLGIALVAYLALGVLLYGVAEESS